MAKLIFGPSKGTGASCPYQFSVSPYGKLCCPRRHVVLAMICHDHVQRESFILFKLPNFWVLNTFGFLVQRLICWEELDGLEIRRCRVRFPPVISILRKFLDMPWRFHTQQANIVILCCSIVWLQHNCMMGRIHQPKARSLGACAPGVVLNCHLTPGFLPNCHPVLLCLDNFFPLIMGQY